MSKRSFWQWLAVSVLVLGGVRAGVARAQTAPQSQQPQQPGGSLGRREVGQDLAINGGVALGGGQHEAHEAHPVGIVFEEARIGIFAEGEERRERRIEELVDAVRILERSLGRRRHPRRGGAREGR